MTTVRLNHNHIVCLVRAAHSQKIIPERATNKKKSIYLHTFIYSCSGYFFCVFVIVLSLPYVQIQNIYVFILLHNMDFVVVVAVVVVGYSTFFSLGCCCFIIFNLFIVFSNYEYGVYVQYFVFIVQHNNVVSVLRPQRVHRMLNLEQNETIRNEQKSAHRKTLEKRYFGFVWPCVWVCVCVCLM